MEKPDSITFATTVLNGLLLEAALTCGTNGEFKTLRNTVEAQFLGRVSDAVLKAILDNLDVIWQRISEFSELDRLEVTETVVNNMRSMREMFHGDERLRSYVATVLNEASLISSDIEKLLTEADDAEST